MKNINENRFEVAGHDYNSCGNKGEYFRSFVLANDKYAAKETVKLRRYRAKRSNVTIISVETVNSRGRQS